MATTVVWTDDGQEDIVDYYDTQTWYVGIGTGGTTAAVTNAALTTEVEGSPRGSTTDSQPAADTFQMVGSVSITGTHGLDEAGIFTANAAGRMHISATFDVVNVVSGDTFQPTFTLQLKDNSE